MANPGKFGGDDEPQLSFAELWSGKVRSPKRPPAAFGGVRKPSAKPAPDVVESADAGAVGGAFAAVGSAAVETAPQRRVWSVASLVADVRQHIEREYEDVWVEGEISNLRSAPSGHIYFTLKDGDAQLPVVLFRRQAMLLRFRPEDGLAVLVRGKVSVYESRGQMQLVAETLEPRGAGALQVAFEQLKAKLAAEGLFDEERKQPLPAFPRCIGVITSPTGAVIHDILNVTARRHARLNILIYPALMQGEQAAREVAAGIRWFNNKADEGEGAADILLIARGGGSLEDLAPFNDEGLARAIAASNIPVVSAIGHETDFTIADFVADLRAPTPSAAAEIITAAQHRVEERIAELTERASRAVRYQLMQIRQRYSRISAEAAFARMRDGLGRRQQRVDELRFRLENAWAAICRDRAQRMRMARERLLRQDARHQLALVRAHLERLNQRLEHAPQVLLRSKAARYETALARLQSLSPVAVLNRGYALVFDDAGRLIRSVEQVAAGDAVTARLADGVLDATVTAQTKQSRDTQ